MKADGAKCLTELGVENARLMEFLADQTLDISMLKEIAKGEF